MVVLNHQLNFAADVRAVTGGSIFGSQHIDTCGHDIVPVTLTQHHVLSPWRSYGVAYGAITAMCSHETACQAFRDNTSAHIATQ